MANLVRSDFQKGCLAGVEASFEALEKNLKDALPLCIYEEASAGMCCACGSCIARAKYRALMKAIKYVRDTESRTR